MTIVRWTVIFLILALAACGGDGGGEGAPDAVVEAVREVEPRTSTADIDVDYAFMKEQVPDATDEDISRWIIEVIEWNDCLERVPTGEGCSEISDDNPRGW